MLMLVDGHNLLHRSAAVSAREGIDIAFIFARMLLRVTRDLKPTHGVVAFDEPEGRHRREEILAHYERKYGPTLAYKGDRDPKPPEFFEQRERCMRLASVFGFQMIASKDGEADDVIASMVMQHHVAQEPFPQTVIVSADRDLTWLLLFPGVAMWDGEPGKPHVTEQTAVAEHGIPPVLFPQYLALIGKSGQIPGVPGIGPVAAKQLLLGWGSLKALYTDLDTVHYELPQLWPILWRHRERAFLSLRLAELDTKLDVPAPFPRLYYPNQIRNLLMRYGYKSLVTRV